MSEHPTPEEPTFDPFSSPPASFPPPPEPFVPAYPSVPPPRRTGSRTSSALLWAAAAAAAGVWVVGVLTVPDLLLCPANGTCGSSGARVAAWVTVGSAPLSVLACAAAEWLATRRVLRRAAVGFLLVDAGMTVVALPFLPWPLPLLDAGYVVTVVVALRLPKAPGRRPEYPTYPPWMPPVARSGTSVLRRRGPWPERRRRSRPRPKDPVSMSRAVSDALAAFRPARQPVALLRLGIRIDAMSPNQNHRPVVDQLWQLVRSAAADTCRRPHDVVGWLEQDTDLGVLLPGATGADARTLAFALLRRVDARVDPARVPWEVRWGVGIGVVEEEWLDSRPPLADRAAEALHRALASGQG
jgi:hypothetical protein